MAVAQRFFRSALSIIEKDPVQITTDGHASYPRAIDEVLGSKVKHRCSLQESPDRARSSRHQTTLLPDAGFRLASLWPPFLLSIRRGETVLSAAAQEKSI